MSNEMDPNVFLIQSGAFYNARASFEKNLRRQNLPAELIDNFKLNALRNLNSRCTHLGNDEITVLIAPNRAVNDFVEQQSYFFNCIVELLSSHSNSGVKTHFFSMLQYKTGHEKLLSYMKSAADYIQSSCKGVKPEFITGLFSHKYFSWDDDENRRANPSEEIKLKTDAIGDKIKEVNNLDGVVLQHFMDVLETAARNTVSWTSLYPYLSLNDIVGFYLSNSDLLAAVLDPPRKRFGDRDEEPNSYVFFKKVWFDYNNELRVNYSNISDFMPLFKAAVPLQEVSESAAARKTFNTLRFDRITRIVDFSEGDLEKAKLLSDAYSSDPTLSDSRNSAIAAYVAGLYGLHGFENARKRLDKELHLSGDEIHHPWDIEIETNA